MPSAKNSPPYRLPTNADHEAVSALFLGPKAENFDLLKEFFSVVLDKQKQARLDYHPEDKDFITANIMGSDSYKKMKERLRTNLGSLTDLLNEHSIPFFSPRYSAHMTTDVTIPGILGYMSTMIFNPNNVAFEASPITTWIEIEVGKQLCEMLGYNIVDSANQLTAWGHITCDGTVANLEAIWSARNLKFYPLSLRDAMETGGPLEFIADTFRVRTTKTPNETKLLRDLDLWELLNLKVTVINEIPERLYNEYGISGTFLERVLKPYLIQSVSKDALEQKWSFKHFPQILISKTKHYSWPKGAAIAGLGSENAFDIPVDHDARVDVKYLRDELYKRLAKKQAVYMVVAIIGSTEEGAVDSLSDILALRDEMEDQGLSFVVHADAAWGGYFTSVIRPDKTAKAPTNRDGDFVPHVGLRESTRKQLERLGEVDSITIDPHKSGYIPYPAGGLCYRDGRQRYLLTWTAPYINQSTEGESIGVYGVEGSKPGASAAAVYLAHEVIGLNSNGHGVILGEASFNCRRFASHWSAMSTDKTEYIVVPFNPIPAEKQPNSTPQDVEKQKEFIRTRILNKSNEELVQDEDAMNLLNQLGSDLNINAFACNFRDSDGNVNTDIELANRLNWRVFQRLSVTASDEDPNTIPFYLTSTTFAQEDYQDCATNFKKRLGLVGNQDLLVLRNVVMSPFGSTDNFVKELASIFKGVLIEEIENVRARSTPQPAIHTFIMQGTSSETDSELSFYFVHLPSLYIAGGGYQLIFRAEVSAEAAQKYRQAKKLNGEKIYVLHNETEQTVDELLSQSSFKGYITSMDDDTPISQNITVKNIKIVKKRDLRTNDYDVHYPSAMPFYLYGTPEQAHIDHVLLLAPNIQLTAGNVKLSFKTPISTDDLKAGLFAFAETINEDSMQPFPSTAKLPDNFFFHAQKRLKVSVYKDPYPAVYENGPIDLTKIKDKIGEGEIVLEGEIYIDSDRLNEDSTFEPVSYRSRLDAGMRRNVKQDWVEHISRRLA